MNDKKSDELEPVDVSKLVEEFSDHSIAELMLSIKELREALDQEKKAHSYDELKLRQANEKLEDLEGKINTVITALTGEVDEQTEEND